MEAANSNTVSFKAREPVIHKIRERIPKETMKEPCYRCGRTAHFPNECRFKYAHCHGCGKKGHIAPVCRSAPQRKTSSTKGRQWCPQRMSTKTNWVQDHREEHEAEVRSSSDEYVFHQVGNRSVDSADVQVKISNKQLSGASLSIILEKTRKAMFGDEKLRPSKLILKTYTNEPLKVTGTLNVRVQYEDQLKKLVMVVVVGNRPNLFGRNWLNHISLNWKKIFALKPIQLESLHALMRRHQRHFSEGLDTVVPYKASLHLQQGAKRRFFKPRVTTSSACHQRRCWQRTG